jgi:hypothetical protein
MIAGQKDVVGTCWQSLLCSRMEVGTISEKKSNFREMSSFVYLNFYSVVLYNCAHL